MRKSLFVSLALILFAGLSISLNSQEHPQEHPTDGEHEQHEEHPEKEGHEHPEKHHQKKARKTEKAFLEALDSYLAYKLEETDALPKQGMLPVQRLNGKPFHIKGDLSLDKIHRDKVIRYAENTYFVCSDFIATHNGEETTYDFDFFMTHTEDGWRMGLALLHKINGEKQITYSENKPVPAGKKTHRKHDDSDEEDHEESESEHPESGSEHPH